MIGERIGHLRVIASIGVGGMGAVWHAVDELLDRHVALKVIRPELMSRPGLAERFRSEAIVLARLQHPCIAALYGLEKRGDEFVMVMEFVDGETLDVRLAQHGPLPWPEATRITRAVLDALDHAHESGVIHRDIKPANVMITRAGRVKVMDFGIARLVGAQRQTRTGAAVGTPSYMSPEQLLGQEVDGRADVYAVATLLYELTTGHLPFEVEGDYLRMIAQLQQIPAAPSTHNTTLPSGLDLIVARALQKEPDDRYATSGEFRDALEELEREYGVLRPYGTPAAGSSAVAGGALTGRGTPSSLAPVAAQQPAPPFNANPAAVLTPVESAMSLTPVPFAVDPVGATPIDLEVPASQRASAAEPERDMELSTMGSIRPTPEFVVALSSSASGDRAAESIAAPAAAVGAVRRSALPRAVFAGGAIAVVAVVGVLLTRNVTARENEAAQPPVVPTPLPAATLAVAPVPSTPAVASASDSVMRSSRDLVDSAAIRKSIADSLRAVRKAARDSARAARDSAAATATVFSLPGAVGGPSAAEVNAAKLAGRRAADECVAALNAHDMSRLDGLFGGDRKNVLRIAKDGKLDVSGPLQSQVETDAADRATARFAALLQWKNGNNEDRTARASLRAIAERSGAVWATKRCLIDNDGGARF